MTLGPQQHAMVILVFLGFYALVIILLARYERLEEKIREMKVITMALRQKSREATYHMRIAKGMPEVDALKLLKQERKFDGKKSED